MDIRRIDLLAAGIIIMILVLAFFALFKEDRAKAAVLEENKNVLLERLRSADDVTPQLDKIKIEINEIQKNLDEFDRQLPEEKRIHNFLIEIDRLAKNNRVALEEIRPGRIEKGTLYSRLPIKILGNSGFKDFYRFLFQLENIPRITMMENLRISKLPEEERCYIDMELSVFVGSN